MVADLTRFSACTVHPEAPDQPVPEPRAADPAPAPVVEKLDPTGDEPVRLFVWASA